MRIENRSDIDSFTSLILILLKNPMNASTKLSMNGKSPMISTAPPFVLRLSKDERRVFQQNHIFSPDPLARFKYEKVHGIYKGPADHLALRALMLAVLEDAIACYQGYFFKPSRTNERLFQEPIDWINSNDYGLFSFSNICETLAFQPENFRKGLERWKAKQKGVRIEERRRLIINKGKYRKRKITAQGSTSLSTKIQQRELRAI